MSVVYIFTISPTYSWAVAPESQLYSDKPELRNTAYEAKELLLRKNIALEKDDEKKKNLQIQQQLLKKIYEIQDPPPPSDVSLGMNSDAQEKVTWEDFELFLDKYISSRKEYKKSKKSLELTTQEKHTLYNQLLALAEDDPEQHILQLQHAYQVRKEMYQESISHNLEQNIDHLRYQFPQLIKQLHIETSVAEQQKKILEKAEADFQQTEKVQTLSIAALEVLIQEQESLLANYLGQDLSDADKKRMHYNQVKLLEQQVKKLVASSYRLESNVSLYQEKEQLFWFQLLGSARDNYDLTDDVEHMSAAIIRLRKEISALPSLLHDYDSQLSTLQGGNALIGPKAKELIPTLENDIQATGTKLSAILKKVDHLEHRTHFLKQAIKVNQSSMGAIVLHTRQATGDMLEKIQSTLTYPLLEYNGMSISLLLILQLFGLLVVGIFINRLYGHLIQRMGVRRKWSERTIHLVQAIGRYPFIFILAMVMLSVVGINTSSLALVAGALSVGIGFGMQTIVNNLVSGVILLFDKSIRPGDFISLGDGSDASGYRGNVVQMNTRATVLRTNDNINIIIPNADLIASKVVNWTYGDDRVRFRIPFSVAYGSDIEEMKTLVTAAINEIPLVLTQPEPQIWMTEHADSCLEFVAAIWVRGKHARQPARTSDTILTKIYTTLHQHNIEIPLPQMDLNLRDKRNKRVNTIDSIMSTRPQNLGEAQPLQ
jgi:small-conductance mechanosensitive channel